MDIRPLVSKGFDMWSPTVITGDIAGFGSGTIQLEYGWQLVAAPVQFGYWNSIIHKHIHDGITEAKFKNYILDQIEDLYGTDKIEVANTYTGDNQFFYSFIVGVTPENYPHNWNLIYSDSGSFEISGFWINVVGIDGPYTISWGES